MAQSSRNAVLEAARQTLAPPPSSIAVEWIGAALSQMEAPLPHEVSPLVNRMFNSLAKLPTVLLALGV